MKVKDITVCAAQIRSHDLDSKANLAEHVDIVHLAAWHKADCVVFPELSLTGYCPEDLQDYHFLSLDSSPVLTLATLCDALGITAIFGAPLAEGHKRSVAAFICRPGQSPVIYRKQHLYGVEKELFTPGEQLCVLDIASVPVGIAICADTGEPEHAARNKAAGAGCYAAGVLSSIQGYDDECIRMQQRAVDNGMSVLMANYSGMTGGWQTAGGSAIWDKTGHVVVQAPHDAVCLAVCRVDTDGNGNNGAVVFA